MIQEILLATLVLIASTPNSSSLQETVQTAFFTPLQSDIEEETLLEAPPEATPQSVQNLKETTYTNLLDTREDFISHVDEMQLEQKNAIEAELTRGEELIVAADVSLKQGDALSAQHLLLTAHQHVQKVQMVLLSA